MAFVFKILHNPWLSEGTMVFSLLPSRMRCTVTCGAVVLACFFATHSVAAENGCKTDTLENLRNQAFADAGKSLATTAITGVLLIAARDSKPIVLVGSALLAAIDLPTLAQQLSDARQLFRLPADRKQLVEVCPADDALARAFHFQRMSIVAPPGVGSRVGSGLVPPPTQPPSRIIPSPKPPAWQPLFPGGTLADIIKQIDGLKEAPKPLDAFLQRPPATAPSVPQPPSAPRANVPPTRNRIAATLTGAVFDAESGRPIGEAVVQVTVLDGREEGHWWKSATLDDGTFDLRVPGDDYRIWVKVPGYYSYGRPISLRDGAHQNLRVPLTRQTPYPCDFTVVNKTGWRITLYFDDGGPRGYVRAWSSASFELRRPVNISPAAEFSNRPPMTWGNVTASCDGAAYVNLLP